MEQQKTKPFLRHFTCFLSYLILTTTPHTRSPLYRRGDLRSGKLSDLLKVTQEMVECMLLITRPMHCGLLNLSFENILPPAWNLVTQALGSQGLAGSWVCSWQRGWVCSWLAHSGSSAVFQGRPVPVMCLMIPWS